MTYADDTYDNDTHNTFNYLSYYMLTIIFQRL